MDQTLRNRTKKFLSLLKNSAQNEAFVHLVSDNLKLELQQRPWKMLRVLDFIVNELPRSTSDFTRLKVNESGLISSLLTQSAQSGQAINQFEQQEADIKSLQKLLDHMNSIVDPAKRQKFIDKLNSSILILSLDSELSIETQSQNKLAYFTLSDLIKSNKTFFHDLVANYQPLLSGISFNQSYAEDNGKDKIKEMVMKSIGFKTDKIKLSDLIDESFFDDIGDGDQSMTNSTSQTLLGKTTFQKQRSDTAKYTIAELLAHYKQQSYQSLIDLKAIMTKRQKTTNQNHSAKQFSQQSTLIQQEQNEMHQNSHKFLMLSPQLALVLHFVQLLNHEDWKVRQYSASLLNQVILLSNNSSNLQNFSYHVAIYQSEEEGYQLSQTQTVSMDKLQCMMLPYLFFFMLKDELNDYEELKVLTPAREEGFKLFQTLLSSKGDMIQGELNLLIAQMPVLLKAVEVDTWISRYNFFMMLKGLVNERTRLQIFQMFNRVLIESLLKVEEEVMILVTELIQSLLDLYIQQPDYASQLSLLLNNLQENLKQSDEIESSSISVFSLINKILETTPNLEELEFNLDLDIICPFNFHKVINVRYSYNQIISKCLQSLSFTVDKLQIFTQLTLQSLTMERSQQLVSLLYENLKLLITHFQKEDNNEHFKEYIYNQLLNQNSLPFWLYSYQLLPPFESFIFFESKNFESIEKDYYKIVQRPTFNEEIRTFYYGKMNNLTKAVAILMSHSATAAQYFLSVLESQILPGEGIEIDFIAPVHESHFIYLLVLSQFYELALQEVQNQTNESSRKPPIANRNEYSKPQSLHKIWQYLDSQSINRGIVSEMLVITEESIGIYQFSELQNLQTKMNILIDLLNKFQSQINDNQQSFMRLCHLNLLLQTCYAQYRLVNLGQIQQQIEILTQVFDPIQVPEVRECFSELVQLFTSLINYANSTSTRVKSMAAITHINLVNLSQSVQDLQNKSQDNPFQAHKDGQILEVDKFKSCVNQTAPPKGVNISGNKFHGDSLINDEEQKDGDKGSVQLSHFKSDASMSAGSKKSQYVELPKPEENSQMQIDTTLQPLSEINDNHPLQIQTQSQINLTAQLNNLIKPILNSVKTESIDFIQEINCIYLVKLLDLLCAKNKSKAGQQVLSVFVKSLEQSGQDENQDRGSKLILREVIKNYANIFKAYNGYLNTYMSQNLTSDNYQLWVKSLLFISRQLKECKLQHPQLYEDQTYCLLSQLSKVFDISSSNSTNKDSSKHQMIQNGNDQTSNNLNNIGFSEDISKLVTVAFEVFKQSQVQLISIIVSNMEKKERGAFQSLISLLETKNHDLMRFIPVFIIPVIQNIQYSRRIFNDDKQITLILASLLSLLPLNLVQISDFALQLKDEQKEVEESEANKDDQQIQQKDKNQFLQQLQSQASEGYKFLQIFVNNQMIEEYKMEVKVKAQLRDYQKQGINWMATLGHYNLNCALCDDMGLGKTLQSLCVVVNESYKLQMKTGKKPLNMIVCPTTITHNWHGEINKFFDNVKSVVFEGTASQKSQIISSLKSYDFVIISYEKLRNEIKSFENFDFLYLILDEAHIIKNGKAKITQAVKQVKADKKLALTGTPLQNRVSELWSIFDFLMPGFLEEENIFNKKYNQYLTSNIKRLSEKLEETQSFLEALKSLKKRIQPFILRRTKDQVLKELPPKIIQDVICELTPFQEYTHSQVEKIFPISQSIQQMEQQQPAENKATSAKGDSGAQPKLGKQILQNLIMHRKVCNHPMFVAKEFKDDKNIQKHLGKKKENELMSYENSGKLIGLYDKLVECEVIEVKKGDGAKEELKLSHKRSAITDDGLDSDLAASSMFDLASASFQLEEQRAAANSNGKHRVLIFCQMTSFLKVIVEQILQRFNVPYLELLSQHTPKQRVEMCNQFNADPSVRVLILTTQVGGLGLNLTGADTVIFAEHDWNPMRDLQAIDRAHRIGQTRQVCVYRLIMKDTIEEKIMGLQRFKENLAKSLVQAQGAMKEGAQAASQLEMSELLNSFQEHSAFQDGAAGGGTQKKGAAGQLVVEDKLINNLDEIWQGGNFENM